MKTTPFATDAHVRIWLVQLFRPGQNRDNSGNAEFSMASVHRSVLIQASASRVWSALQDVGALHTRLVPGFVTECQLEGETRLVTFANGIKARELIVDVNPELMRVSWSAVGGRLTHHNASAQVVPAGNDSCQVVWIADFLPNEMAPAIAGMIEQGLAAMKAFQESKNGAQPFRPGDTQG